MAQIFKIELKLALIILVSPLPTPKVKNMQELCNIYQRKKYFSIVCNVSWYSENIHKR